MTTCFYCIWPQQQSILRSVSKETHICCGNQRTSSKHLTYKTHRMSAVQQLGVFLHGFLVEGARSDPGFSWPHFERATVRRVWRRWYWKFRIFRLSFVCSADFPTAVSSKCEIWFPQSGRLILIFLFKHLELIPFLICFYLYIYICMCVLERVLFCFCFPCTPSIFGLMSCCLFAVWLLLTYFSEQSIVFDFTGSQVRFPHQAGCIQEEHVW